MSNTLEKDKPMNYPKRGCRSKDLKTITYYNGKVAVFCETEKKWKIIKGAYVPSDEEREACDMARAMIHMCGYFRGLAIPAQSRQACGRCSDLSNKSCPARLYLAAHKQPDAWEIKP